MIWWLSSSKSWRSRQGSGPSSVIQTPGLAVPEPRAHMPPWSAWSRFERRHGVAMNTASILGISVVSCMSSIYVPDDRISRHGGCAGWKARNCYRLARAVAASSTSAPGRWGEPAGVSTRSLGS